MRYGFYLPTRGPTATRGGILALAREGERDGKHEGAGAHSGCNSTIVARSANRKRRCPPESVRKRGAAFRGGHAGIRAGIPENARKNAVMAGQRPAPRQRAGLTDGSQQR